MDNHCMLVNLMGICSGPDAGCEHYRKGYTDCFYHCDGKCCHAGAIYKTDRKDRRSRETLKGLLDGVGV
jgi:hypothetical protein